MRRFELATPDTVAGCLEVLAARGPTAKVVAGGTDLLPQMKNGLARPATVVDLSGIRDLQVLEAGPTGLRIGAAVTARQLERSSDMRNGYGAIAESAAGRRCLSRKWFRFALGRRETKDEIAALVGSDDPERAIYDALAAVVRQPSFRVRRVEGGAP